MLTFSVDVFDYHTAEIRGTPIDPPPYEQVLSVKEKLTKHRNFTIRGNGMIHRTRKGSLYICIHNMV
jgi:hypothetical protein